MTDYSWIQPGVKVRIKTFQEIQQMYPDRNMPHYLKASMDKYCGTIQNVTSVQPSRTHGCVLCVNIQTWMWPETVLEKCVSKLGNLL